MNIGTYTTTRASRVETEMSEEQIMILRSKIEGQLEQMQSELLRGLYPKKDASPSVLTQESFSRALDLVAGLRFPRFDCLKVHPDVINVLKLDEKRNQLLDNFSIEQSPFLPKDIAMSISKTCRHCGELMGISGTCFKSKTRFHEPQILLIQLGEVANNEPS